MNDSWEDYNRFMYASVNLRLEDVQGPSKFWYSVIPHIGGSTGLQRSSFFVFVFQQELEDTGGFFLPPSKIKDEYFLICCN